MGTVGAPALLVAGLAGAYYGEAAADVRGGASLEMHLIEYKLGKTVAVSGQPIRVARYVQLTELHYA